MQAASWGLLWLCKGRGCTLLQTLAMGLLIHSAGSTDICEPGDSAFHNKPARVVCREKRQLPKDSDEVWRWFILQLSLLLTEGWKVTLGNFLKGKNVLLFCLYMHMYLDINFNLAFRNTSTFHCLYLSPTVTTFYGAAILTIYAAREFKPEQKTQLCNLWAKTEKKRVG